MIRPFQIGDLFLVQRLGRQAARLNSVQSLLEPQSSFWATLLSIVPLNQAKVATHVLRQKGHRLLGDGFLQVRKRPGRAEVDITYLAPALMSDLGHPAIWEKLLGYYNQVAAQQRIERIYADVADQPLPIATLNHAGYRIYARQTIWRLAAHKIDDYAGSISAYIRPQTHLDQWALHRLYSQIVPKPVQMAEGASSHAGAGRPLGGAIVQWLQSGVCTPYVLEEQQEVRGALQIVEGRRGVWFQLWADTNNPNPYLIHELLRYGLSIAHRRAIRKPIYMGVHDYQAGLNAILSDYEFAPVTDRARMVRHVAHWVRDIQTVRTEALESSPQIAIAPFELEPDSRRPGLCYTHLSATTWPPHRIVDLGTEREDIDRDIDQQRVQQPVSHGRIYLRVAQGSVTENVRGKNEERSAHTGRKNHPAAKDKLTTGNVYRDHTPKGHQPFRSPALLHGLLSTGLIGL